jgi:predicted GH43/DUF377 family glycosyl hydrolase
MIPVRKNRKIKRTLLSPREDEREGYVPNVFLRCDYSQQQLILPYAVSDYSSTYAVVDLAELISALKRSQ